ncbi:hypothetical protein MMAD_30000 [Mycolicibacterium madagascariense]|uniref:Uncharacterized protein n=1 Tax=Mycolicibacterium madagascariense TaxID=212765 RepID=A0A7I7XHZ5_9MYCO|nr:hypothetical protein [Mycolicibacterium madagascariense]MCV7016042.1 hypothetical protein [Mycolicibacterium madagascariense]BBZ28705.1 hypothetical protein MMAD_30000 [Mycolicibacterium madagascariense]
MTTPTPWWENDPELLEIRRRIAEQFGSDPDAHDSGTAGGGDELEEFDDLDFADESAEPVRPDAVRADVWTGRCRRELGDARDALRNARERYDAAVVAARTAGLSWGEIGIVLGVARQQLHRRFSTRQRGRP